MAEEPCPTCTGPTRETVGMICQTCGTDYSAPEPDAFRDPKGGLWLNLRKHQGLGGVYDATSTSTPLWLTPTQPTTAQPARDEKEAT